MGVGLLRLGWILGEASALPDEPPHERVGESTSASEERAAENVGRGPADGREAGATRGEAARWRDHRAARAPRL